MGISKEKMDRILAGEDPKAVLNAAELKKYTAAVKHTEEESGKPEKGTKPKTEKSGDEGDVEGDKPEEKPTDTPVIQESNVVSQLLAMNTEITTLRLQLDSANEANAKLTSELAIATQDTNSLLPLAQAMVTNLQVALMKPKQLESTASGLVTQYTELKQEQAKVFSTGRLSTTPSGSEEEEESNDLDEKIARLTRAASSKTK